MSVAEKLLTAEEYEQLPDLGYASELVQGRVVPLNQPGSFHGLYCGWLSTVVGNYAMVNKLGRIMTCDAGVITERDPDSVRGPDVAYYSFQRFPKGEVTQGYVEAVPELVFEVRSPSDRSSAIQRKVGEYLAAGVELVCVFDPQSRTIHVYRENEADIILSEDDTFTAPNILPGFQFSVRDCFDH